MNPVFYVGCFVGVCILPAFALLQSMFEHFTTARKRELADEKDRCEKAARERDEWKARHKEEERRHNATLDLLQKADATLKAERELRIVATRELKTLQEHHNSTLPCL